MTSQKNVGEVVAPEGRKSTRESLTSGACVVSRGVAIFNELRYNGGRSLYECVSEGKSV